MSWNTDWIRPGYTPVETVEARVDEDAEQDNARDDLNNWGGDWE